MRQLKFRAWDEEMKEFYFFDLRQEPIEMILIDPSKSDDIQQFTGLLDKSGKDIYEGDVVECMRDSEIGNSFKIKGEVVYSKYSLSFGIVNNAFNKAHHLYLNTLEIIGNIHENPELL